MASASSTSRGVVVTTASVKHLAARAASRPFGASSTTGSAADRRPPAGRLEERLGVRLAVRHVIDRDKH